MVCNFITRLFVLIAISSWSTFAFAKDPILDQILNDSRAAFTKQERPMVVFDIDGTLLDNRSRTLFILREYSDKELRKVRPDEAQKLGALSQLNIRYSLPETLLAVNITDEAIVNNAAIFWSQRFFADAYLKYDTSTPGSVNFVRTLYTQGARIIYLTGRDQPRQLIGTVQTLRDNGFPIGIQGTELIMKPTMQTQDAVFKQQVTNYIRHYGKLIAAFDNEPSNTNVYRRAFESAKIIIYDAPHSGNPPPLLPNIMPLKSFE